MPEANTSSEAYLMEVIINNKAKLEVDWPAVMAATGLKSVGGAKNKLRYLERDYKASKAAGSAEAGPSTPSKKAIKRKADEVADEAVDGVAENVLSKAETPKTGKTPKSPKTPKTPRAKKVKACQETQEQDTNVEVADDEHDTASEIEINAYCDSKQIE